MNKRIDEADSTRPTDQRPCVLWFTGLSGAGKSTLALALDQRLQALGKRSFVLDGDAIRSGLNSDLGFSAEDRVENIRRVSEVAKLFVDAGLIVIVAFISPFARERSFARSRVAQGQFIEIFVDTPLDVCEKRDPKGLYRRARAGRLPLFTGIDSPYEPPTAAEIVVPTVDITPGESVEMILGALKTRGLV